MAINEIIVTGRKHRRLVDKTSKLWQRTSFWTKARDVEFDDGQNLEAKINSLINFFQAGVEKIVNKLKGLGFTPIESSPNGICNAIDDMYNSRYQGGYQNGYTQGQKDFTPVIKYGSQKISHVFNGQQLSHVSCVVTIPKNLDYVCCEITSIDGFETYFITEDYTSTYIVRVGTSYNKATGDVKFDIDAGQPFHPSASTTFNYKIMYIPKE